MSITYEEALSTLTSMFGPPWTRETLDAVLRHHGGHMENTVESVLRHGDGDPQALVDRLKSGEEDAARVSMDEELARQLANEEKKKARSAAPPGTRRAVVSSPISSSSTNNNKGRGTLTELPPDFLRVPGYTATGTSSQQAADNMDADEQLARMLQDEFFTRELRNNPEFAHLASPRTVGGRPTTATRTRSGRSVISTGSFPGASQRSGGQQEGPNIMEKLSEMGETAKKRLSQLAAQWNANLQNAASGGTSSAAAPAERRSLLDGDGSHDEEEVAFAMPPSSENRDVEMRSNPAGAASSKKDK